MRRRRRNEELDEHFQELAVRAARAERTAEEVVSREPAVFKFRDEMREVRLENGFTRLFLKTVGGSQ